MAKKKGLHISKEQLEEIIVNFGKINKIECLNEGNGHYRYNIENESGSFNMNVFFRKDKTVTCNVQGTEEETLLGNQLVQLIINSDEFKNIKTGSFSCKLSQDKFVLLKEYLINLDGVKLIKDENKGNNGHIYKFLNEIGDCITLTYYDNLTLSFQGYLMQLHTEVKCFINAYKYVKTQIDNQTNEENKKREQNVNIIINKYLSNSYQNLEDYLKDQIYDSIDLIVIHNEMRDYSSWTFQILKALEGRIKQIFSYEGIIINDKKGFKLKNSSNQWVPLFNYNDKTCEYTINKNIVNITNVNIIEILNSAYTYLNKNRSEIFHTKPILTGSRRIDTPEEAEAIVFKVCKIIEESFNKLGR